MNSLAQSLCAYLCSRNNDIAGYWGIGMLCAISKREKKPKFSFKIYPGELLRIYGCEITGSKVVTDKLVNLGLDSIEGRLSFFEKGSGERVSPTIVLFRLNQTQIAQLSD